jgi:ubiquinone/menaquinone biosynthesis C-methylase UbiE
LWHYEEARKDIAFMKDDALRVAEQFRRPHGRKGREIAELMKKYNGDVIHWIIDSMSAKENDVVLEIGFGPGLGIKRILSMMPSCIVYGIDFSRYMVRMASKYNADEITTGKAILKYGDANKLPFEQQLFDKVFAVNVLYFWNDPSRVLNEIKRTLKPNGTCILGIAQKSDLERMKHAQTKIFQKYDDNEVIELMKNEGFKECRILKRKFENTTGVCVLGTK